MIEPDEPFHRRAARNTLDRDSLPPPLRFVGSGRGIMIAVLTLVALLVVARIVATWWMVEDAWAWWNAPVTIDAPLQLAVRPPPTDIRLARRPARGNAAAIFTADDYPAAAIRAEAQGRTVAKLAIDAGGRPTRCIVMTSSGSRELDRATCNLAMARGQFAPARDEAGRAIGSTYTLPVRWVLPRE